MDWVDFDGELEGGDEGGGGEVECDDEPILSIGDKCLSGSDACELTVDIDSKHAVANRAACGNDGGWHQAHGDTLIDDVISQDISSECDCGCGSSRVGRT